MSGRYGDEDKREAEYQQWRYYTESGWEDRDQAVKLKQRTGATVTADSEPEPVLSPVKPPEGPLPVVKARPVFNAYPAHAALIEEAERKFAESRQHMAEPEEKETED